MRFIIGHDFSRMWRRVWLYGSAYSRSALPDRARGGARIGRSLKLLSFIKSQFVVFPTPTVSTPKLPSTPVDTLSPKPSMSTPEDRAALKAQIKADMERAHLQMEEVERAEEEERKEEERRRREEEERLQREAEERRLHEAEEQRNRKEEEERQRQLAEFKKNEAAAIARREELVMAVRAAKAAEAEKEAKEATAASPVKGREGDKGKKRARSEPESESEGEDEDEDEDEGGLVGNMVEKRGVMWMAESGRVCIQCSKAHRQCLWRGEGGRRARACLHCYENKKGCRMTAESGSEPPNKKSKTKVESEPVASGSGSGTADLLEKILAEIQLMRQDLRTGFREVHMEVKESRRTGRGIFNNVAALKEHFMEGDEKSEEVSGEADATQD
jgi:hypothetical protein